jgi:hypothetical protein
MEHIPTPPTEPTTPPAAEAQRSTARNSAIVVSFIAALILVAWLSTLAISYLPAAFSSLATLAESLTGREDRSLTITNSASTVQSGDEFTISWDAIAVPGTFTFSYDCSGDVSISIITDSDTRDIRCGSMYSLGDATSATLSVTTSATEETTVPFTVAFLRTNDIEAHITGSGQFVVTTEISQNPPPDETPEVPIATPDPGTPSPLPPSAPEVPPPSVPTPQVVYVVPVSDPRGTTDLATRFIAIGVQNANTFTPRTTLLPGEENALRFEVKNHGTKTSDSWSYRALLPDGSIYEAEDQKPLRPNEQATITIRFDLPDDVSGLVRTSVTVDAPADTTDINDRFIETVRIAR